MIKNTNINKHKSKMKIHYHQGERGAFFSLEGEAVEISSIHNE